MTRLAALLLSTATSAAIVLLAVPARAQTTFDQQQAALLNNLMMQNQARMAAVQQSYLQQFGPMLRQQYVATGANQRMTFDQFAYWMMMTANGTNVQGALDAQREQFAAQQRLHKQQVETGDQMVQGMRERSERQSNAVENWDRQSVQGNAPYVDPRSGQTQWLPYAPQPGQTTQWGGNTYAQDRNGNYWVQDGNRWVQMNNR